MKFSLAIVAFVAFAAVATAAPSESLEEVALKNPLEAIKEKLKELYEKFVCAREVVEDNIKGSGYEKDLEEFKRILQEEVYADLTKCNSKGSKINVLKCKFNVYKTLPEYFEAFFEKLHKKNQEVAKKIRDQVQSECFDAEELFEFEEVFATSIGEQFQCMADVLADVSKANGLEEEWRHTQPILQIRIDNLKKCDRQTNKLFRIICTLKNTFSVFRTMTEYFQVVAQKNPEALKEFIRQAQQKCQGAQDDELEYAISDIVKGVVDKLKCVKEAVGDAVKDTDFQGIFEEFKTKWAQSMSRIQKCKELGSVKDTVKCMFNELKSAKALLTDFLHELRDANKEAYELAKKYIKERCTE